MTRRLYPKAERTLPHLSERSSMRPLTISDLALAVIAIVLTVALLAGWNIG